MIRRSSVVAAAAAVVALSGAPLSGQSRTPDGQPDVQGFWANQTHRLATYNIEGAADPTHGHRRSRPERRVRGTRAQGYRREVRTAWGS